eukprot:GHVT01019905.1.p1 GENE.GHVT01019905.1~~GHVT01019905.1.p1  ORF type:complete len:168 (-),score=12.70 GHVT01019905.1:477-980(-)
MAGRDTDAVLGHGAILVEGGVCFFSFLPSRQQKKFELDHFDGVVRPDEKSTCADPIRRYCPADVVADCEDLNGCMNSAEHISYRKAHDQSCTDNNNSNNNNSNNSNSNSNGGLHHTSVSTVLGRKSDVWSRPVAIAESGEACVTSSLDKTPGAKPIPLQLCNSAGRR